MYKKDTSCHIFICNNLNIRGWFESQPDHHQDRKHYRLRSFFFISPSSPQSKAASYFWISELICTFVVLVWD